MGKNRKYLSVTADHYEKLKAEADRKNVSVSSLVESYVATQLGIVLPQLRKGIKRTT